MASRRTKSDLQFRNSLVFNEKDKKEDVDRTLVCYEQLHILKSYLGYSFSYHPRYNYLRILHLQNAGITHIDCLRNSKHLLILIIDRTGADEKAMFNLTGLEDLAKLQKLSLTNVHSGVFLERLTKLNSLTNLSLTNCSFVEANVDTGLGKLTKLVSLKLDDSNLTHIEQSKFEQVYSLYNLQTLDGLSNLTNLTTLSLFGAAINLPSYSPLSRLTKLKELDLVDLYANDMIPFESLPLLEYVKMDPANMDSIASLLFCKYLKGLEMYHMYPNDLDVIGRITSLKSLMLYQCLYSEDENNSVDVSWMGNLTNLEKLYLRDDSCLVTILSLTTLPKLRDVEIVACIDDIDETDYQHLFAHVDHVTITDV